MRAIATILCLYLFGLHIQPVLFPLHSKGETMACCKTKDKKQQKGCKDCGNEDCNDNQCNPFFSQCPVCAANAVPVKKCMLNTSQPLFFTSAKFFSKDDAIISQYPADILHPPQFV